MKKRIFFDLILFATIFYTPWWGVVVLACAGSFLFSYYYEVIVCGVIFDLLYGSPSFLFGGGWGTMSAVFIFFISIRLRKMLR